MKKLYICPQISFESIEDEDLMINTSNTATTSYLVDPKDDSNNTPGIIGEDGPPIGWDDEGDD